MTVVRRLLVAAYLIEAGLLLVVVPWTSLWQHNYFGFLVPSLGRLMTNAFVRGAVSGIGLITAVAGLRDLVAVIVARQADRANSPAASRGFR